MKVRVKLTADDMATFFARVVCCNTAQILPREKLMQYDEYSCCECERPLAIKASNGHWYTIDKRLL